MSSWKQSIHITTFAYGILVLDTNFCCTGGLRLFRSQTSWVWLETKLVELGMLGSDRNYKVRPSNSSVLCSSRKCDHRYHSVRSPVSLFAYANDYMRWLCSSGQNLYVHGFHRKRQQTMFSSCQSPANNLEPLSTIVMPPRLFTALDLY